MKLISVSLLFLLCSVTFAQDFCNFQANPVVQAVLQPEDATLVIGNGSLEPCMMWFYYGEYLDGRMFVYRLMGAQREAVGYAESEVDPTRDTVVWQAMQAVFGDSNEHLNGYTWGFADGAVEYFVVDAYIDGLYVLGLYPIGAN